MAHFTSNFFVHSKIFIIFAHNILKPYHEANLSQRPVAGYNKNTPPISESPQAEGSWSHQRLRLTEMTFALLERVIDTAQRLGLQLNPREQSILIATLRGDSRRAIAQEMSITPQEVSRQADAALQQLTLFLNRMATDEDRQAQQTEALQAQQRHFQQRIQELNDALESYQDPEYLRSMGMMYIESNNK